MNIGLAFQLSTGYSFNEKIGLGMSAQHVCFLSTIGYYTIKSYEGQVKYYHIETNSFIPYIGMKAGIFQEKTSFHTHDEYINNFGISPSAGILFFSSFHDNVFVNIELAYSYIFTESKIRLVSIGIGLRYVFN